MIEMRKNWRGQYVQNTTVDWIVCALISVGVSLCLL